MAAGAGRRGRVWASLGLITVMLGSAMSAASGADVAPEPIVKAEFIERISRLVDWPEQSFASSESPMALCLIGDDPFGDYLLKMSKARTIQGRRITLTHVSDLGRLGMCNVVFVARSEDKRLDKILEQTSGRPILTVADTTGFAERGVLVNFYLSDQQKVRFEVNVGAVNRSGLHISSKILRVARLVGKKP
jgi:hypothetical protein